MAKYQMVCLFATSATTLNVLMLGIYFSGRISTTCGTWNQKGDVSIQIDPGKVMDAQNSAINKLKKYES